MIKNLTLALGLALTAPSAFAQSGAPSTVGNQSYLMQDAQAVVALSRDMRRADRSLIRREITEAR